MNEKIEKLKAWVMGNKPLAAIIGFVLLLFVYKKFFKKRTVRRRRRIPYTIVRKRRAPRSYTKGGASKKPWQIKGSEAAKRRMRAIRRKRSSKLI